MNSSNKTAPFGTRAIAIAIAVIVLIVIFALPSGDRGEDITTFEARKGPLKITVLEGGELQALESQIVRSEVEGREGTLILSIVEEGYMVTEEDVTNGKILVELDSSALENQITQQEITFQSTEASLTEAVNNLEIQISQNESDIKDAEQQVRFARLDFEKYMGDVAAKEILDELKLERILDDVNKELAEEMAATREADTTDSKTEASTEQPSNPGPKPTTGELPAQLAQATKKQIEDSKQAPTQGGGQRGNRGQGGGQRGNRQGGGGFDPSKLTPEQREKMRQFMQQRGGGGGNIDWKSLAQQAGRPSRGGASAPAPEPVEEPDPSEIEFERLYDPDKLNFAQYAEEDRQAALGDGQAGQKLRELSDSLFVQRDAEILAQKELQGKRKLHDKQFITKIDLDNAELQYLRTKNQVQSAETALSLFKKYDLAKEAEQFLSLYEEALRGLQRTKKQALATLAQVNAKYKSAQRRYEIEKEELDELKSQFSKCIIKASTPGLVVYGGGESSRRYGSSEEIREGASVRERQVILRIPNTTKMSVTVKIDESEIKKVIPGLSASLVTDAEPDRQLTGEVTKVGVLPDSGDRWLNPDLKVYKTTISVDGSHDWLKPGMSTQVEILVNELQDVVYVPLLAVHAINSKHYCYLMEGGDAVMKEVTIGQFNDEFVEIKQGIQQGDVVYLRAPNLKDAAKNAADNATSV